MVGPLARGEYGRTPTVVGMAFCQVRPLGPLEIRPRSLVDPFPGHGHLPRVLRAAQPETTIHPRSPQCLRVGGAGCACDVLPAPHHQRVICLLDGSRQVARLAAANNFGMTLASSTIMAASGAIRWGFMCPHKSATMAEML